MEKAKPRTVLKFAGAFISYMIGSGFASGQEILQFFTAYGLWGLGGCLISLLLFDLCGGALMARGYDCGGLESRCGYRYYCGKLLGAALRILTPVLQFGMFTVMLSGAGAALNQYYGLPRWLGSLLMALLSLLSICFGLKRLIGLLGSLGMFTILFTLSIAIGVLLQAGPGERFVQSAANLPRAAGSWWFSGILYVSFNTVNAVPFLTAMGATANTRKEARLGAFFGSLSLMAGAALLHLAMLDNISAVSNVPIPVLYLANSLSPIFGVLFSLVLYAEILSTAAPMLWMLSGRCAPKGGLRGRVAAALLCALSLGCCLLPFERLVGIIYPYTGYVGLVLLLCVLWRSARPALRR